MKNGASGMVLSLPTRTVSRGGDGAAAAGVVAGAVGAAVGAIGAAAGGRAGAFGWQATSGSTTSSAGSQRRQAPVPLVRRSALVAGHRRSCTPVPLAKSRFAEQVSIGSRALDKAGSDPTRRSV